MMEKRLTPAMAHALHRQLAVVDCHCDTLLRMARYPGHLDSPAASGHVSLTRLQEGGVKLQFMAAFIESIYKPHWSLARALRLIDTFHSGVSGCRGQVVSVSSNRQIRKGLKEGRTLFLLGIEGGEALAGDLSVLRMLYRLGVRLIGLTWNQRNDIADGVGEKETGGGLTRFGRSVVKEMNRLGMIIDLAHISETGFWEVLKLSDSPVMVSHANCQSLCSHPRNLTDDQIKALADTGGILGLSFVPEFIGKGPVSIEDFLDHIDHVAALAGTDVIALGSDFDGFDVTPAGLEDCRCFSRITGGLVERGYTELEIRKIMGENVLRFMEKVFAD